MPPHHHHHGGHGGGGPFFSWGGGPGWWDYPSSELVVVEQADKSRDKILAYIASLPEKERGKAFAKFFGAQATSGVLEELGGMFDEPKGFVALAGVALVLYLTFRKRPNPSRRRRRRYRRRR